MVLRTKTLGVLLGLLVSLNGLSQSYSESFETFTTGSGISDQSIIWARTTTGGGPGGLRVASDAVIVENRTRTGDKAIYIAEGARRTPDTDVSCSFQNLLQLGDFRLDFYCYLASDMAAYYALQGSQQVGNAVVFQFATDGNGQAYLRDYEGNLLKQITHTQDDWVKMSFRVNLVTNEWVFLMDDTEQTRFSSTYNSLASVQFVAQNTLSGNDAGFWVDDLSYSFEAYELQNNNCQILEVEYSGGEFAGTEARIHCTLRNLGNDEINSITMGFVYNGVLYEESIPGLSLFTSNTLDFTFSDSIIVNDGVSFVEVVVLKVDGKADDVASDNTAYLRIKPFVISENKVALLEGGVSTTCGLCPSAYVAAQVLQDALGDKVIPIMVHSGDAMDAGSSIDGFFDSFAPNLPFVSVDRTGYLDLSKPDELESAMIQYFVKEPLARLQQGAFFSTDDPQQLVVTTQLNLNDSAEEEGWRLACALLEKGYQNSDDDYRQKNDYFLGIRGEMGGFENQPRFIPAEDMTYQHVLRAYQPSFEGIEMDLAERRVGDSLFQTFYFDLDEDWNTDSLELVSFFINPEGQIDQAYKSDLQTALNSGVRDVNVDQVAKQSLAFQLFPNPSHHQVSVRFSASSKSTGLSIVDVHGRIHMERPALHYEAGHTVVLPTADLAPGKYILRIQNDEGVFTSPFQKL